MVDPSYRLLLPIKSPPLYHQKSHTHETIVMVDLSYRHLLPIKSLLLYYQQSHTREQTAQQINHYLQGRRHGTPIIQTPISYQKSPVSYQQKRTCEQTAQDLCQQDNPPGIPIIKSPIFCQKSPISCPMSLVCYLKTLDDSMHASKQHLHPAKKALQPI